MTAPRSLTVPPVLLAVVAILSVQFGNAIAGSLFSVVGPLGAAALRMTLAAAILCAVVRPRVRGGTAARGRASSRSASALPA